MLSPEREAGGRRCLCRGLPPSMTVPGAFGAGRERARAEWFVAFFVAVLKADDEDAGSASCPRSSLRANAFPEGLACVLCPQPLVSSVAVAMETFQRQCREGGSGQTDLGFKSDVIVQ